MKAESISRREFAKREGVSETLVRRGIKQKRLRPNRDGRLDPALVGSGWRASIENANRADAGSHSGSHHVARDEAETHAEALRRKEIALANLREHELATKSARFVDRAAAEALFFATARADRDAWLAWPARVSVLMASEIAIDRSTGKVDARSLTAVLSSHFHQHLTEMGEPQPGPPLSPGRA